MTDPPAIRPAQVADAAAMLTLTQAVFGALDITPRSGSLGETVDSLTAEIAAHGGLVAEDDDGEIVGSVRFGPHHDDPLRLRWVRRLAVAPEQRGRGLAGALVAASVAPGLVGLRAGVRHQLPANAARFRRWGFDVVRRHDFWDEYGRPLARPVATAAAMRELGRGLADLLVPGDLVLLTGPLGAGKTTLAQGIGAGLGVAERLTSPTFVLAREHTGRLPVVHADAYRLGGRLELDDLDLDTPAAAAVTLVEWGQGLAEGLADGHLEIGIERSDSAGDEWRAVTLRGMGAAWEGRRAALDAVR